MEKIIVASGRCTRSSAFRRGLHLDRLKEHLSKDKIGRCYGKGNKTTALARINP